MAQALVLALGGTLAAVLNRLSGGALHAWIPWFTRRLLEIAAIRSPYDQRERLAEEWESHINEVSGDLGKIVFAYGCVSAAHQIALMRMRSAPGVEQQDQERQSVSKMQTPIQSGENPVMHGIPVALLSEDRNPLTNLQDRLRATSLGREVFSHVGLPTSGTDIIIRQLQESRAEVVIVDVRSQSVHRALHAIELIRSTTEIAIFASGDMTQPANIVASMRSGASEYVDRSAGHEALLEALTRFSSLRTRALRAGKARVYTFLGAKGGVGCTTAAVNTALALQISHGDVVLVDFAHGHTALQLNLRPRFCVLDALRNIDRMDAYLLDGYITTTREGLHLLAGPTQPEANEPTPAELARLVSFLVNHYRFVIIDASSRMDRTTKLLSDLSEAVLVMAQTDVLSLWCADRIQSFVEDGARRDRVQLVLNRYRKVLGFGDKDIERVTNCKVFWKIPNDYCAVAASIDRGSPIVLQERSEVGRSYRGLAAKLVGQSSRWGFPSPASEEGPEGAGAAGIAVERPRSPNLNSGSAAARLG
jgi:pilus assembly protein CpaE